MKVRSWIPVLMVVVSSGLMYAADEPATASECVECHNKVTPNIVSDWKLSKHSQAEALGVLDPDGKPTALVQTIKAADVARLSQEDWQRERDKMIKTCNQCHSGNFAKQQLEMGDEMIRNADHLMAEAIRVVAGLYKDGVLEKPKNYSYAFPNLLTFHDAPTVIEQKLFVMYLEHRMRTFEGTFHASPDYAMWYGWSEMQRDLTEIKELADTMRRNRTTAMSKPGQ
jgi:hydroxylamine dehydrogenase